MPHYEHLKPARHIALIQLAVYSLSWVFLYMTFYYGIVGMAVSLVGVYATMHASPGRVQWVKYYVYGNVLLLLMLTISLVFWILYALDEAWTTWNAVSFVFGAIFWVLTFGLIYTAYQRGQSYRNELIRHPPSAQVAVP